MADPISTKLVKDIASDLSKNSKKVVVVEAKADGKSLGLQEINIPDRTQNGSVKDVIAVHLSLAEKAGIKMDFITTAIHSSNGKNFDGTVQVYNTDTTLSPDEIKKKLSQAANDVKKMTKAELEQFSIRVNEIRSNIEKTAPEQKKELGQTTPSQEETKQSENPLGKILGIENPLVKILGGALVAAKTAAQGVVYSGVKNEYDKDGNNILDGDGKQKLLKDVEDVLVTTKAKLEESLPRFATKQAVSQFTSVLRDTENTILKGREPDQLDDKGRASSALGLAMSEKTKYDLAHRALEAVKDPLEGLDKQARNSHGVTGGETVGLDLKAPNLVATTSAKASTMESKSTQKTV